MLDSTSFAFHGRLGGIFVGHRIGLESLLSENTFISKNLDDYSGPWPRHGSL